MRNSIVFLNLSKIVFVVCSTWFETFGDFIDWIFTFMVIKNEDYKSCLVSNIRTFSNDL